MTISFSLSPAFTYAADAFVILNSERQVLALNRTAEQLFGPLTGATMPCYAMFGCHADDGQCLQNEDCVGLRVLAQGEAEPYTEMNLKTQDGRTLPVSVSYSLIPQADGGHWLFMAIRDLSEKRRLEHRLQEQVHQLATLQERERLAREFHDGLAQTLAFLNIQAAQLDQALAQGNVTKAKERLAELRLIIQSAYRDVRHALYDLRVSLEDGLSTALRAYCESFGARNELTVHFSGEEVEPEALGADQAAQMLRIVQESLTNVRKHSRASDVWVTLAASGDALTVTIRDNGVGFAATPDGLPVAQGGHYGILTMRERAHGIGGTLHVQSTVGSGTTVVLQVPKRADRASGRTAAGAAGGT